MDPPTEREKRFASALEELVQRQDRAALAALRRGLGKQPGEAAELFPYVVPWLPDPCPPRLEEAYYLVAALFAWHQGSWRPADGGHGATNFGGSFARFRQSMDSGGESVEKRFLALLNSHREDLPEHLRRAVGLLKSKEIPVDWAQLLHDVQGWDWESRSIQRDWAAAFWGGRETVDPPPAAASSGPTTSIGS